jgi:hypothetical protein
MHPREVFRPVIGCAKVHQTETVHVVLEVQPRDALPVGLSAGYHHGQTMKTTRTVKSYHWKWIMNIKLQFLPVTLALSVAAIPCSAARWEIKTTADGSQLLCDGQIHSGPRSSQETR